MKSRAKSVLIRKDISIKKAMEVIQSGTRAVPDAPGHIALAVDKKNRLIGILTDGDIRRALLSGMHINDSVEGIINRNPVTFNMDLTPEEILIQATEEIKKRSKRNVEVIVLVDEKNQPHDIFTFFELWRKTEVKTRVISIIGLGYVGLTLALVLADVGFKVVGVDNNRNVVNDLNRKKSHIYERGINNLLKQYLDKNFFVQHDLQSNDSDIYIISVGTPVNDQGRVIIEPLENALKYIAKVLKKEDLVILRSTIPIGTCRNFVIPFIERETKMKAGEDFFVAFAPERTIEGAAINELRQLPQVIGGFNKKSSDLTVKLFNNITNFIVLVDDLESAEMVKLLNNTYRDLTFSFANEVALICDKLNLNSYKVIKAANYGYGRSFIAKPSPGVGGYCLTKDPLIFAYSTKKAGYKSRLALVARKINEEMIGYVCNKVDQFIKENKKAKSSVKIFVIGLAFKGEPETSDMRNSTSLEIAMKLEQQYGNIVAYDPVVSRKDIEKNSLRFSSLRQGFCNADCVLILNNHRSYQELDIFALLDTVKKPGLFFDAWHLFHEVLSNPVEGVVYRGI
ncbi:nucleotide sugar dehydrogenase [Patescibacteria group bacterium]|nr:nucleotide sugar dehydrogenase [Patescibacteria group bacterium]